MPSRTLPLTLTSPMAATGTKVLLLGAGELGKELTIALQRLGVYVVAVDRYANAPAMQVAHASEVIDMKNPKELKNIINKHAPTVIVPEIEALATEVLLEIESNTEIEIIPTAKTVDITMNRKKIRKLAAETLHLPTTQYAFATNAKELETQINHIGLPCVIKPIMSSSGKGQITIKEPTNTNTLWRKVTESGRVKTNEVIIEKFIEFDYELTVLAIRYFNHIKNTMEITFCEPIGHQQKNGDYVASWQPVTINKTIRTKINQMVLQLISALTTNSDNKTTGRGLFGVELFIKGDEVIFSEVSPRPHDTGLVTLASQQYSEFELHARAILGLPISTKIITPAASAVIYGQVEAENIHYENIVDALNDTNIDIRLFGKPLSYTKRRMGVILAQDINVEIAKQKATTAANKIKIQVTQ